MAKNNNNLSLNKFMNFSIILIGITLIFLILERFAAFLRPFIIAVILMFIFLPILRLSKEKKLIIAGLSVGIIVICTLALVIIGTLLIDEINLTGKIIPQGQTIIQQTANNWGRYTQFNFGNNIIDLTSLINIEKLGQYIGIIITTLAHGVATLISELFLVLLFLVFLLHSYHAIIKKVYNDFDGKKIEKFNRALEDIEKGIRTYVITKSLISLGTALVSAVVLWILGARFIVVLSVIIFFLNFIPNIGSIVAVMIAIGSYLVTSGFDQSLIILAILLTLIQVIFGNIIEPKVTSDRIELSPIIILLSLFFWGSLWGTIGMLFAVPLTVVIKIILQNVSSTKNIVKFVS